MNTHGFRPPEPDMTDVEVFDYAVKRLKLSLSTGGRFTPQGYLVPRNYYDGVSPKHPRKIALEIVEESRKEKGESDSPNPYKIRPGRSFRASRLVYGKMKPLKLELRRRAVAGTVALDLNTIYVWYLEYLLYIALEYTWHQAAVAILKVLYILDYEEFRAVVNKLDYSPQRFPSHLRNQKERIFAKLEKQFKIFGIETEKIKVGSKTEEHFKRVDDPAAQVDLVAEILRTIRPANPLCTLHTKSRSGVELLASLEILRTNRARKNFDNEAEMEIMQLLTCPDCLSITFEALGFGNWREKLGLPFFSVRPSGGGSTSGGGSSPSGGGSSPGGGNTTQMNKSEVFKTEEGEPTEEDEDFDLQSALEQREERRRKMPIDYVLVVSDNATWVRVSLDQPAPAQLHLLPGDSLIEIMGQDDEGTLPLDYREVSWDPELEVNEPHVFDIKLKNDRRVELTVTYQKDDSTGDLIAATVDITYKESLAPDVEVPVQPDEPESVFWPALLKVAAAAAVVCGTASGVIILFSVLPISYWFGQNQKASSPATYNANTAVVASKESSPSPITSPETRIEPTITPTPLGDLADKPKPEGSGSPATAQVPEGAQPTPQEVVTPHSAETTTAQSQAPPPPAVLPSPADTAASNAGSLPESHGAPPSERSSSAASSAASAAAVPDGGAPSAAEALREGVINVKVTYLGMEIQDALVVLADRSSGVELTADTFDTDGNYSFLGLKTGSYNLKVEKEGFKPEYRNNIEVKPGKTRVEEVRIKRIADDPAPEPESAVPAVASAAFAPRVGRLYGRDSESIPSASPFRRERDARPMPLPLQSRNIYEARGASVAPRRASAPPPALMFVEVDIDQPICVSLLQPLSSLDSRVGQTFRTSVLKPVYADGIEAIPEGSIILGMVSWVRKAASSPDGKGMVAVQFTSIHRPTHRAPYDIAGELRGLADDPVAAARRAEATVTSAPPLTNPRMVFVGDEEKGFRVAPIDEAAAAPAKNDDATRHATLKGSEAVVGASTRVCLSLEKKLRLPVFK